MRVGLRGGLSPAAQHVSGLGVAMTCSGSVANEARTSVVKRSIIMIAALAAVFTVPCVTHAQQNVPPSVRQAEAEAESAVERFAVGVQGGIGLDPELIDFGAHASFGPIFRPMLRFRPGIEFGLGELTTVLALNFDVLYTFRGSVGETRWMPYVGAGPNFSLSHRGLKRRTATTSISMGFQSPIAAGSTSAIRISMAA